MGKIKFEVDKNDCLCKTVCPFDDGSGSRVGSLHCQQCGHNIEFNGLENWVDCELEGKK